jgi:hypothetical protein
MPGCPPDPAVMFAELRQALEVQQVAIAERLEAVRQAEAALVHLHDVLAMPFLPLPRLTGRVTSGPGCPTGRPFSVRPGALQPDGVGIQHAS